jgi:hypothetical protein
MGSTPEDDESIVGEECHIVARASGGPRNDPNFPKEKLDQYDNLILLCRNDGSMFPQEIINRVIKI